MFLLLFQLTWAEDSGGTYSIGRLCRKGPSVVPPSVHNFKTTSSETTGPIVTKFHIQSPVPLGTKSCSNGLGHITNVATMPIYVKTIFRQV